MTEEDRAARLARARFWVRAELAIALSAVATTVFLWLAQPATMGDGMFAETPPIGELVIGGGIVGIIVGFAAMFWLSRVNPERGERTWRYRC
jgi:uncharacterized PurR-regulated membrane protein YhhQ (DUF165 family)